MTHLEQYNQVFIKLFGVAEGDLPALIYLRGSWDSLQHIEMITMTEDTFNISINPTGVVLFNSYEKGKETLRKYNVEVWPCLFHWNSIRRSSLRWWNQTEPC